MRRVIDGKRYDTERATRIATFTNGFDSSSLDYFEEELYLTRHGAWFLTGAGHAMSPYASTAAGGWSGWGSDLRPFTPDQAREWLERHDAVDALDEHFGDEIIDA